MVYYGGADDYFHWLTRKVIGVKPDRSSTMLLRELYSIPFKVVIPNDSHRLDDGIGLRDLYEYETGKPANWVMPCSVLEVMVSIATYVAEDVIGSHYNSERTSEWFWMMVDNLGLRGIGGDDGVGSSTVRNYIHGVVEAWINRDFEYDGTGSPFPIKRPSEDQRKIEIWKQICTYIVDNPWLEK